MVANWILKSPRHIRLDIEGFPHGCPCMFLPLNLFILLVLFSLSSDMFTALALVCSVQFAARNWIRECLRSPPVRPYEISVEQKVLWTFLFGTMLFIAIVGNSIVIWIVLGKFSLSCHLSFSLFLSLSLFHITRPHRCTLFHFTWIKSTFLVS